MTKRLEQAFAEAAKLPQQEQDALGVLLLHLREERLTYAAAKLAEPAFQRARDNPGDANYERLE